MNLHLMHFLRNILIWIPSLMPVSYTHLLAEYADVPVWNGLTNEYHPTQLLADMLTIKEHFGRIKGIRFVYMGDARYNMGNSIMIACSKMGMHFTACTDKKYFPDKKLVDKRCV